MQPGDWSEGAWSELGWFSGPARARAGAGDPATDGERPDHCAPATDAHRSGAPATDATSTDPPHEDDDAPYEDDPPGVVASYHGP